MKYQKDSPQSIQSMFNAIAERYDLTNAVLSFYCHKYWNRALIRKLLPLTPNEYILLDLCSGTGDIAFDFLSKIAGPINAYLIDFSAEMLEFAKRKSTQYSFNHPHQISYLEADVQQLPLHDNFANCATMGYGIRNVQHPSICINEVFRVLKPGGAFAILELTRPHHKMINFGHQIYLKTLLPFLGKYLTKNKKAYEYLCESIQSFISPQELEELMKKNRFINTQIYPLMGGIATILIGYKPH